MSKWIFSESSEPVVGRQWTPTLAKVSRKRMLRKKLRHIRNRRAKPASGAVEIAKQCGEVTKASPREDLRSVVIKGEYP